MKYQRMVGQCPACPMERAVGDENFNYTVYHFF